MNKDIVAYPDENWAGFYGFTSRDPENHFYKVL